MDIKELKKLINEEVKKVKEATEPGTPRAKLGVTKKEKEIDPEASTLISKDKFRDPNIPPPVSKQTKSSYKTENPEDFFHGILRLHNALRDKFDLEMGDQESYELIREITSEEIEKIRQKYPHLNLGHKLG